MSDETIVNEKKAESVKQKKDSKKKTKFGTSFSDLLENFGKGGWVLFLTMLLTLLVMVGTCLAVFFASVKGEEQVMVPNVIGKTLTNALFDMQKKELYPRIALKYSELPGDEGTILAQDPAPGSIVKAYRRIDLTVSRGVAFDTMENYVGKNIDEVQTRLKTLFADTPSIEFAPLIYQKSTSPAGTILSQYPPEGTDLEHLKIYFVVSTSNNTITTKVPNIKGMSIQQVYAQMEKYPVVFDFSANVSDSTDTVATVTSMQDVGESVEEFSRIKAEFVLPANDPDGNTVYGIYKYNLPKYPYPLNVMVECSDSEGNITKLVEFIHTGDELTVPYMIKRNSVLTLYVNGQQVTSQIIQ